MNTQDAVRPWKIATIVLGVACAALLTVVVISSAQSLDPSTATGKIVPPTEAPVALRAFKGPDALVKAARGALSSRMQKGKLTFRMAGVESLAVDTTVVDKTELKDGKNRIAVSVKMLITKQPGNSLLAAISATGSAVVGSDLPPAVVEATKNAALDAAAESTFGDLLETLKSSREDD